MSATLVEHPDRARWTQALCDALREELEKALAQSGRAAFIAAGGTTPTPVYQQLAAAPLDWRRVIIAPSDERCVPASDPARNDALLARSFEPQGARLLSLCDATGQRAGDADAELGRARPFHLALLGMGVDGHTLSWFPGARGLADALAPQGAPLACVDASASTVAAPWPRRVTLTLGALLETRSVLLVITGAEKRRVIEHALASANEDAIALPVRALLQQQEAPVEIHWAE